MRSSSYSTCGLCGGAFNESGRGANGMYVGVCHCSTSHRPPPGYERTTCFHCRKVTQRPIGSKMACRCMLPKGEVTRVWVDEAAPISPSAWESLAPASAPDPSPSFDSGGGGDFGGGGASGDW